MKVPPRRCLANTPTPVETVRFNGKPFLMKRDDLTGLELSGNKVRKLEYLLHGVSSKTTDVIFTCGGEQSNHARAVTIAAAKIGVPVVLFLWGKQRNLPEGNLFMNTFLNARVVWLDKAAYWRVNEIMEAARRQLEASGKRVLVIPEGGTSPLGIWGYITAVAEMKLQPALRSMRALWVAAGSGGTAAGLLVGAALHRIPLTVYAVNVLYPADEIRLRILETAARCVKSFRLPASGAKVQLEIVDGYSSEGYKRISPGKVDVIRSFAAQSGIFLDPAYTGKAFCAFHDFVLRNKSGMRHVFLHTGGFQGILPHRREYLGRQR